MDGSIYLQIMELAEMTTGQLRTRYEEVFGENSRSGNGDFMRKRIAWRIQSQSEGSLTERAKKRAMQLANESDLRARPPKGGSLPAEITPVIKCAVRTDTVQMKSQRDSRLPIPGTLLNRKYKGKHIVVTVQEKGFSFEGREYSSLSAIASEVTGARWNGFQFFKLASGQKEEAGK